MVDHYRTLGVSKNADAKQIKQKYRELARKHHPDRGGNAETFKQINGAYEVLGDAQKRRQYDVQHFSPATRSRPNFVVNRTRPSFVVNRTRPSFVVNSVTTSIEINGTKKTVTTTETKNGVTTKNVTTSDLFSFW